MHSYAISAHMEKGIKVILHYPQTFPLENNMAFSVSAGTHAYASIEELVVNIFFTPVYLSGTKIINDVIQFHPVQQPFTHLLYKLIL